MPEENTSAGAGGQDAGSQGGTSGSTFQPITSQDELNRVVGDRVSRERAKYADYDDLKAKAAKLDDIEQASKTELQREREAREAAEKRAEQLEMQQKVAGWRKDAADTYGVPADALRGSTEDEIKAHAEQLKTLLGSTAGDGDARPSAIQRLGAAGSGVGSDDKSSGKGRAAAALRAYRAQGGR